MKISRQCISGNPDNFTVSISFEYELERLVAVIILGVIMLSVNFFCNISSYNILAYITKNYIALIYYTKIVHLLCQFHAGKVGVSAVCQAMYS